MTNSYRSSNPWITFALVALAFLFLWFFVLPALIATVGAIDFSVSHGAERHGASALQVRECLNQKGALQEWTNPLTGRRARVCEIAPGVFGIQILTEVDWKEITSFTKEKLKTLEQVMRYLRNTGYQPIH